MFVIHNDPVFKKQVSTMILRASLIYM